MHARNRKRASLVMYAYARARARALSLSLACAHAISNAHARSRARAQFKGAFTAALCQVLSRVWRAPFSSRSARCTFDEKQSESARSYPRATRRADERRPNVPRKVRRGLCSSDAMPVTQASEGRIAQTRWALRVAPPKFKGSSLSKGSWKLPRPRRATRCIPAPRGAQRAKCARRSVLRLNCPGTNLGPNPP